MLKLHLPRPRADTGAQIVFDVARAAERSPEILRRYKVPADRSDDLVTPK